MWGVALALAAAAALLTAAGSTASRAGAFFRLSPISAAPSAGGTATIYKVTVSSVSARNQPTITWTIHLARSASACDDSLVLGGSRVGVDEYSWAEQGPTFVWYHGPAGSYAADRRYGCEQSEIGHGGYPGTLSVAVEGEYSHCTATFPVVAPSAPSVGPASSCGVGGHTVPANLLPVPAGLLSLYGALATALRSLISELHGSNVAVHKVVTTTLDPLLRRQQAAFATLFPPVWGCSFASLFGKVSDAEGAIGSQVKGLAASDGVSAAALAADASSLGALARAVGGCERTGAPAAVARTLSRLQAQTTALSKRARSSGSTTTVASTLPAIASSLAALVDKKFPPVFGIPYGALVERTLAEQDAATLAGQATSAQAAAASLAQALVPTETVGAGLHTHQRAVIRVENKNA